MATDFPEITHQKRRAFLTAFSECGVIRKAAKMAKIVRKTHHNWMHDESENGNLYREAFARAKETACDVLEEEAIRRAHEGNEEPVFYKGSVCGTVRKYSDVLLIFLLKAAAPEKYRERQDVKQTGAAAVPVVLDAKSVARELLEAKDYAAFQRSRALAEDTHTGIVGTNGKSRPLANGTPPSNGRQGTNGTSGPNGHT